MKAKGTVLSSSGGLSKIRVQHGEYCANCGLHDPSQTQVELDVVDPIGVNPDQVVEFESKSSTMLPVMLLVFWLPILAAALGAFLGHLLANTINIERELPMSILAILFFIVGTLIVYKTGKRVKAGTGLTILRVVPEEEANGRCDRHRNDPTHECQHHDDDHVDSID